ncbi:MAG: hypothetical protein AB2A00_00605 [Myxococcota bacterium]
MVRAAPFLLVPLLVMAASSAWSALQSRGSSPPLVQLAALAEAAVLVDKAADLGVHAAPALDFLGMSMPELSARQAGVIRGQDGSAALLTVEGLGDAAIPPHAPLAVLLLDYAPAPVVAVQGISDEECATLRAAVAGGPTENDGEWRKAGVCVTVVGECGRHRCGPVGLPPPGKLGGACRTRLSLLESLPTGALRAVVGGTRLRRFLPSEAEPYLRTVDAVAMRLDASAPTWKMLTRVALTRADSALDGWQPLAGRHAALDPAPVVEVTLAPDAASLKRVLNPREPPHGAALQSLWGDDLSAHLVRAGTESLTLAWRGVDSSIPPEGGAADRLFHFFGGLTAVTSSDAQARALGEEAARRFKSHGFEADGPYWVRGPRLLGLVQKERQVAVMTGPFAQQPFQGATSPVQPPSSASGAVLRVRGNGRRLRGVMESVPTLHGASRRDLRGVLAVRELFSPSLTRLGELTAWLVPEQRGARWSLHVEANVGPPR